MQTVALTGLLQRADDVDDSLGTAASDLAEALRRTRQDLRAMIDRSEPRALAAGLLPALEQLCRQWEHPPVRLEHAGDVRPHARIALTAYQIVHEALANAAQHARATRCRVRAAVEGNHLLVEVDDDGRGLPAQVTYGIGLLSMRGRAVEVGGDCQVGPRAGGGTRVRARLPLATEAPV